MAVEDPAVGIARVEERIKGLGEQLAVIDERMATKEGTDYLRESIDELRKALADERLERQEGDSRSLSAVKEVAQRLQLVEDRQEARKYLVLSGIVLGILGIIFGIFGDAIRAAILGG